MALGIESAHSITEPVLEKNLAQFRDKVNRWKGNHGISYSLADVEPADTGMDALMAENAGLKKTVEALQQELAAWHKGTAGHTFSKTAMRDLARRIKNEY